MLTIWIISFIISFGYITYCKIKNPTLSCISYTYYILGWMFTAWAIFTGCSLLPIWLEITPETFQFLPFLSVITLGIVGLAPKYLTSQKVVHFVDAALAITLSTTWCILVDQWWLLPTLYVPSILAIILCKRKEDWLFWIEISAILNIYCSILVILLNNNH